MSTMSLSSSTLADTAGPRLRGTNPVWTTNPRTSSVLRRTRLACRSLLCRPLLPTRAVMACLSCSALAVRGFLFIVRVSSPPSLAVVDVRSAAGWLPPSVPVPLESTWLFTHAVPPAVLVRFKCPRSIRAATSAADLLPRFLLTRLSPAFRETTRFTAPLPCCERKCCDAPYMHSFAQQSVS